jgi:hypothetical protein
MNALPVRYRSPAAQLAKPPSRPAVAELKQLTRRQLGILRTIGDLEYFHGFPPSVRKLTARLGVPPVIVRAAVDRLTNDGFLRAVPQRPIQAVVLTVAGRMYAYGWLPGRAPTVSKESNDIDIRVTQRRRCDECHRSGLKFVAMHKPLIGGPVLCSQYIACPWCGASRNA